MWMKHEQKKENFSENDGNLLPCPMCKGRGYFPPTQASMTKDLDYFFQEKELKDNAVRLPKLQAPKDAKQKPQPRYKYSLPSINNVKNFPEPTSTDWSRNNEIDSDFFQQKNFQNNRNSLREDNNLFSQKLESRIISEITYELSVRSSVESKNERSFMSSPKTSRNPGEILKTALIKLKDNNWHESLIALKDIIQLARFQPQFLEPSMILVYRGLIQLLKSFRSAVVRTACQASTELFAVMANAQRPEFDELIGLLLQKTADTNKAVRQDASEALDAMIVRIPPSLSVRTIISKGMSHKSPLVRSTVARLLICMVGVVGLEAIFGGNKETRGKIINAGAIFMQDGNQEVRNFGKRLMKMLMQHEDFDDVLQSEVKEIIIRRIEKTLITMKYKM